MRIPIRPHASTPDSKVVFDAELGKQGYGPLIDSIKMAKKVNPDIKIFASTKLQGSKTFPTWMQSNQTGKIFGKEVKCPDPKKYADLVTDYIEQLALQSIKVDFLGLNNEVGEALTPEIYLTVAKHLQSNLKRSKIPDEFKDFEWIAGEEFGVPTSVRFLKTLANSRAAVQFVDIIGSHFYPDKQSGSIESWTKLAALGVPTWHTEVHMRRNDTPLENIVAIRDGLSIVFKTNEQRCEGYIWWDGTSNGAFLGNFVRRQMIKSMLYGSCVKTSGEYAAKDNDTKLRVAQATRVGDTVWLWYFNPGGGIDQLPVKLASGQAESVNAMCFQGGRKVTPQSMPTLEIKSSGRDEFSVLQIPPQSIAVVAIQLKDDDELIPLKSWQQIKPRKKTFDASLTQVTKSTFLFESAKGKKIRVPVKSLDPRHYPEIQDALKAHGIN